MFSFKDLGFSLNLDENWAKTNETSAYIKSYSYVDLKIRYIRCFVLQGEEG